MIEFLTKGMLTTVQDSGRPAFQRFGVPVAGAMDKFSFHVANILVGNNRSCEAIEVTIVGPSIRFHSANIFAICGGDFSPTLNGQPIQNNRAYLAEAGSVLKLGAAKWGSRCYIAFAGGFAIDKVMGSKATYLKGKIGGLDGRAIVAGDRIAFAAPKTDLPGMAHRALGHDYWMDRSDPQIVRVIEGPQIDYFSKEGIDAFLSAPYTVTAENDRMGYRLSGPSISHKEGMDGNIISDGVPLGAIQVAKDQPIVMMADRQTTGGYTKIASVISVDLPYIAQSKAGDKLRFVMTDIAHAQELYIQRMQFFRGLIRQMDELNTKASHIYKIAVNGHNFNVAVREYE
ncbi:MAG: biotin-dependent carboxyltransferase family protein [Christensenellaceae bacterium]|nr:biotin-dependent carboxyltransferase family protein [Christensenellaceae bacterium]